MAKKIFLLISLTLLTGCFSLRDEYAYRASLNVKNHNQLPYVHKVREIDGTGDHPAALRVRTANRMEHTTEQGSFLFVTPRNY